MFHKTVHKAWNLFNLSEQSPEKFCRKFSFRFSIDQEVLSIEKSIRSIKQESTSDRTRQKLQDFFYTISINQAKVSANWKCLIQNFHLENSRTWIFTLWNNILLTQTTLLQPILIYTYIYNNPPLGCNNICLTWLIFYHA